jgi:hypothetical protein
MTEIERAKRLSQYAIGLAFFEFKRAHAAACRADQDINWSDSLTFESRARGRWKLAEEAEAKFMELFEALIVEGNHGTSTKHSSDPTDTAAPAAVHGGDQQGQSVGPTGN